METYSYPFTVERLLFFLSMFLVLLIGSLSSLQPLCHEDERSALLQFKDSFVINKSASPFPSAYIRLHHGLRKESMVIAAYGMGLYCHEETGHIIELDLSGSCLYGSINSNSSVFHLLQLQSLNLAHNDFNDSQIPPAVSNLSRLTYLNLSYSMFSGQIPESLANLSSLTTLDLKTLKHHSLTNLPNNNSYHKSTSIPYSNYFATKFKWRL
jgi:hypothetical protein